MTTPFNSYETAVAQALSERGLPVKPCGLNADWWMSAWHLSEGQANVTSGDHYLLDLEERDLTDADDGQGNWLFEIVMRTYKAEGGTEHDEVIIPKGELNVVLDAYMQHLSILAGDQKRAYAAGFVAHSDDETDGGLVPTMADDDEESEVKCRSCGYVDRPDHCDESEHSGYRKGDDETGETEQPNFRYAVMSVGEKWQVIILMNDSDGVPQFTFCSEPYTSHDAANIECRRLELGEPFNFYREYLAEKGLTPETDPVMVAFAKWVKATSEFASVWGELDADGNHPFLDNGYHGVDYLPSFDDFADDVSRWHEAAKQKVKELSR